MSRSYDFPYSVKKVSLNVESSNLPNTNVDSSIRYYLSVDDGSSWIRISPIENPFSGIPEILSFNENISASTQIPGVSYFNYPQVPKEIRKIRVKIEMTKPSGSNISPIINSYKLCAKVEQL